MTTKTTLEKGKQLLAAATRAPWKWWTSNSLKRITGPNQVDGGVAHAYVVEPGVADIAISSADMEAIEWLRNNGDEIIFSLLMIMKNKDDLLLCLQVAALSGNIGPLAYDRIKAELIRALEWE